jgi:hypothetical protein
MRWLHRFLNNIQQVIRQGTQIDGITRTKSGTESCQGASGITLAAVEAGECDTMESSFISSSLLQSLLPVVCRALIIGLIPSLNQV